MNFVAGATDAVRRGAAPHKLAWGFAWLYRAPGNAAHLETALWEGWPAWRTRTGWPRRGREAHNKKAAGLNIVSGRRPFVTEEERESR